jgi:hypothetical protein
MRCKVGDMVIVIRSGTNPQYIGRILTITGPGPAYFREPVWRAEPQLFGRNTGGPMVWADRSLRPLPPLEPETPLSVIREVSQ